MLVIKLKDNCGIECKKTPKICNECPFYKWEDQIGEFGGKTGLMERHCQFNGLVDNLWVYDVNISDVLDDFGNIVGTTEKTIERPKNCPIISIKTEQQH